MLTADSIDIGLGCATEHLGFSASSQVTIIRSGGNIRISVDSCDAQNNGPGA